MRGACRLSFYVMKESISVIYKVLGRCRTAVCQKSEVIILVNILPLSAYNTIDNGTVLQKCKSRSGDGGGYDSQSA